VTFQCAFWLPAESHTNCIPTRTCCVRHSVSFNEFIYEFDDFNDFILCIFLSLRDCAVQRSAVDIKNRPRIPIPDEDPYSEAGINSGSSSGSSGMGGSGSSGGERRSVVAATREQLLIQSQQFGQKRSEKPPKLPPRDSMYGQHEMPKVLKVN